MDFTPDLSAFQGVLISVDNTHSFSRLTARGGYEEEIQYVIHTLSNFLEQQNCINSNGMVEAKVLQMRKFAMYLVLNAGLPVLEEMVEMDGIDLVIWTTPTIPNCLLCELFWNLSMEKFVFEIVGFCNPQLALEVAKSFSDHMKYFSPIECLHKLNVVTAACYQMICRLHFFNFENDVLANLLTSAFNTFQQCLGYFTTPPNAGRLTAVSKETLYKYKGNRLQTMFTLINECVEKFTSKLEFAPVGFDEMYLLTYKVGTYTEDSPEFEICNSPNKAIFDCLEKCNIALLDRCSELVMDVSVDIFCSWSEVEEEGKSMQQSIGEYCYKLRSKLVTVKNLSEHPLLSMIEQISRKPEDWEQMVNNADSSIIIENINKTDGNRCKWVKALVYKEKLCCDTALVQQLISNIDILNVDDCYSLYKVCQSHLNDSNENERQVQLLLVYAFQRCSMVAKYEILDSIFDNNCFIDMETLEFNDMMTATFNKLIASSNADVSDVLSVFLQSPQKVYTKIFNLAVENRPQTQIMLRVVNLLERYSNHYYNHQTEPCVIKVTQNILEKSLDTEEKQQLFVNFICGLKAADVIPGTKLLMLIVMPSLHRALLSKNVSSTNIQCRLLSEAYEQEELVAYRAPMLAMLAQVLDAVRWKINTFNVIGPSTLELALQLQKTLVDTFNGDGNEGDWLRSKLRNIQLLNLFYYRKLWGPASDNFVEVVSGARVHQEMNTEQLKTWLLQVLCSCTLNEWCSIWDGLAVFGDTTTLNYIHEALSLVTAAEASNRTESTRQCLVYCYRCFVFIVKYKFFKGPLTDVQVSTVIDKIVSMANMCNEEDMENLGAILLPLLGYLSERKQDYTVDIAQALQAKLGHSKLMDTVGKVFANGTN